MSHSSGHYSNRYGNSGSNYYQRKGFLGKLFGMLDSNSGHGYQNNYPQNYPQNQNYPNQTIACIKCNIQLPSGSKFCTQCGEKLEVDLFCGNCAEKLNADIKFCPKCGTKTNN